MGPKKLVMFDFDGVLVNTIEFSYNIHKELNPSLTYEKFQDFSNGNFFDGIGEAIKNGHLVPTREDYSSRYDSHVSVMQMHDILKDTILELAKVYDLSIVSSMHDKSIEIFLEKDGLKSSFKEILGVDVNPSKVVKIKDLLDKYKLNSSDAVLITDSLGDVLEANECGVKSIGVLWGVHSRERLERGNPVKIIDNPLFLYDSVKEVLG